jgi:predicted dinucleotide-binding enzyme
MAAHERKEHPMEIGIIGSGNIGAALARLLVEGGTVW